MIKMICGVYGMRIKHPNGREEIKGMGPDAGPFSLTAEQEKRLVDRGVAVYVDLPNQKEVNQEAIDEENFDADQDGTPIGFDETPPDDFDEAEAIEEPVDLITLSAKELREMGKQYGLTFKVGTTKDDMVAAITNAQADAVEVEDGEPAPVFDAVEAVL